MRKLFVVLLLTAVFCSSKKPDTIVIESASLHCNDTVLVFSPSLEKNIPTLFLLHGYSDDYHAWSNHMDIRELSEKTGFRIICPDGFYASWYLDRKGEGEMKWRTFFWEELWPLINDKYGLDPGKTFIDGLSMGGHGAINIFLDHPECFCGAGSMSGVLDLMKNDGTGRYYPVVYRYPATIEDCEGQSAYQRASRLIEASKEYGFNVSDKLIVLSTGIQDYEYRHGTMKMAEACDDLGLNYIAFYSPAVHSWKYWTWVIDYHIQWFIQHMERGY